MHAHTVDWSNCTASAGLSTSHTATTISCCQTIWYKSDSVRGRFISPHFLYFCCCKHLASGWSFMRKILSVHRRSCILNIRQQHQQFDWNKHKQKWVVVRIWSMSVGRWRKQCHNQKLFTLITKKSSSRNANHQHTTAKTINEQHFLRIKNKTRTFFKKAPKLNRKSHA